MKVMYTGSSSLCYRSAPSGTEYQFDTMVAQKVDRKDETFFRNMANAPNSQWRIIGLIETIKGE
jgi:hypothetical protein